MLMTTTSAMAKRRRVVRSNDISDIARVDKMAIVEPCFFTKEETYELHSAAIVCTGAADVMGAGAGTVQTLVQSVKQLRTMLVQGVCNIEILEGADGHGVR